MSDCCCSPFTPTAPGNVFGPAVSVDGDVVVFNGTTGKLIADSGIKAADLVVNPAAATAGNLASFGDASGNLIGDSGQSVASLGRLGIVNEAGATRTLTSADAGKYIRCSGACVITVNNGVFTAGDTVFFRQVGAGAISFAGTATLTPPVTNTAVSGQQGATIALVFDTANTADVSGDLADI